RLPQATGFQGAGEADNRRRGPRQASGFSIHRRDPGIVDRLEKQIVVGCILDGTKQLDDAAAGNGILRFRTEESPPAGETFPVAVLDICELLIGGMNVHSAIFLRWWRCWNLKSAKIRNSQ